jgi:hypothetical protein
VAYAKARDALNAALTDFVRAHFKEGDDRAPQPFDLHLEVPLSMLKVDGAFTKKPCGEVPLHGPRPGSLKAQVEKEVGRKMPDLGPIEDRTDVQHPKRIPGDIQAQSPLTSNTRVVVRGLIAKCIEGEAFTTWDVESVREPPFNKARCVHPSLMGLARRGLLTHVSPNVWVIPSLDKLEAALSL